MAFADYRGSCALGVIEGASRVELVGDVQNLQSSSTPCLLWDLATAYTFQTSAQSLEILSSSANDAAAGTGARTVVITTLDGSYASVTQTVTLNGTNAVALTGTHLFLNSATVITSGSGHTNAGSLTIRVAGAGATQGYILAGASIQRALLYTVPAGYSLLVDEFFINTNKPSGTALTFTINFNFRLLDGTVLITNSSAFVEQAVNLTLRTGFVVPEKTTVYLVVAAISGNGAYAAINMGGTQVKNSLLSYG